MLLQAIASRLFHSLLLHKAAASRLTQKVRLAALLAACKACIEL